MRVVVESMYRREGVCEFVRERECAGVCDRAGMWTGEGVVSW